MTPCALHLQRQVLGLLANLNAGAFTEEDGEVVLAHRNKLDRNFRTTLTRCSAPLSTDVKKVM